MSKFYTISKIGLLSAILFYSGNFLSLNAQSCGVIIEPLVNEFTPDVPDVCQSIEMTNCGNGDFLSFTVYSNRPHTDVRLSIYEGEGINGPEIHTQGGITLDLDLVFGTTIELSSPVPFTGGETYTFRLTFDSGGQFSLHKSNLNMYQPGALYENLAPQEEDLRFIAQTSALLPVELSRFDAQPYDGEVLLSWQTDSENENAGFEIQRSNDGNDWERIGFVEGAGNSTQVQEYHFTDEAPKPGENYYRLKQIDYNGEYDYSPTAVATLPRLSDEHLTVMPNPAVRGQLIEIANSSETTTEVQLVDLLGRTVGHKLLIEPGDYGSIHLRDDLQKGMYLVVMTAGQERHTQRIVVQ